MYIKRET